MINRVQKKSVLKSLRTFPVTALIGPRQVGKTTLAKELAQQHDRSVAKAVLATDAGGQRLDVRLEGVGVNQERICPAVVCVGLWP